MLDKERQLAIELLIEGTLDKTEIAKRCGRSRRWLYDILGEEEVKAEMRRLEQQIKSAGEQRLTSSLEKAIDNVVYIANFGKSEKVRLEANQYLIDRKLGRPSSKLEVTEDSKDKSTTDDETLDAALNSVMEEFYNGSVDYIQ